MIEYVTRNSKIVRPCTDAVYRAHMMPEQESAAAQKIGATVKLLLSLQSFDADDTDVFEGTLQQELYPHIDWDGITEEGGGTDNEDIDILNVASDDELIYVKLLVTMNELVTQGCRDFHVKRPRRVRYKLTIRRSDGQAELDTEEDYNYEY